MMIKGEWVKSSRCGTDHSCVAVKVLNDGNVAVRDTRLPLSGLTFSADEWTVFIEGVKNGEFDV